MQTVLRLTPFLKGRIMPREIEQIYGYVDLTPEMREWKKNQILAHTKTHPKGNESLAMGWRVYPAHHRDNPTKSILLRGYPDTEESFNYWFDNPDSRDRHGRLIRAQPLPIKSERDKVFFREQNQKWIGWRGFAPYKIFHNRKNYIEAYAPETDFVETGGRHEGMREEIASNVGPEEVKVQVSAPYKKKRGRPRKPKEEVVA